MSAPHPAAYMEATEGAVGEFTVHEMSRIGSQANPGPSARVLRGESLSKCRSSCAATR